MPQVNIDVYLLRRHEIEEKRMVVGRPFLGVEQIQKKVKELADQISDDYEGKNLLAVGILKGAFVFFSGKNIGFGKTKSKPFFEFHF